MKTQCKGFKGSGQQCTRQVEGDYCWQHIPKKKKDAENPEKPVKAVTPVSSPLKEPPKINKRRKAKINFLEPQELPKVKPVTPKKKTTTPKKEPSIKKPKRTKKEPDKNVTVRSIRLLKKP
jgi:hypothetical protein